MLNIFSFRATISVGFSMSPQKKPKLKEKKYIQGSENYKDMRYSFPYEEVISPVNMGSLLHTTLDEESLLTLLQASGLFTI